MQTKVRMVMPSAPERAAREAAREYAATIRALGVSSDHAIALVREELS